MTMLLSALSTSAHHMDLWIFFIDTVDCKLQLASWKISQNGQSMQVYERSVV